MAKELQLPHNSMTEGTATVALSQDCRLQAKGAFASMTDMQASGILEGAEEKDMLLVVEQGYALLRRLGQPQLAEEFRDQGRAAASREAVIELLLRSIDRRRRNK